MSTYLYLTCLDHDPPLLANEESGQHLYDLPQIRDDIARRELWVKQSDSGYIDLGYFRNHTIDFLCAHRSCRIGITDEYGDKHPVVEP